MNDVLTAILTRRSIRSYTAQPITPETLDSIVEAGTYAASARGLQARHITIIEDPAVIGRLTTDVREAIVRLDNKTYLPMVTNKNYTVSYRSPVFAVISSDPAVSPFPEADCALVLANMMLAAHAQDIGSCWINQLNIAQDDPEFRKILTDLGVPEKNRVFGSCSFGYSDEPPPAPAKRKENTVYYSTRGYGF